MAAAGIEGGRAVGEYGAVRVSEPLGLKPTNILEALRRPKGRLFHKTTLSKGLFAQKGGSAAAFRENGHVKRSRLQLKRDTANFTAALFCRAVQISLLKNQPAFGSCAVCESKSMQDCLLTGRTEFVDYPAADV